MLILTEVMTLFVEGKRAIVSSMSEYVKPMIQHCKQMTDLYPGVPLFIIGHSMGGLITLHTSLSHQCPQLRGLVLMGPLIQPDPSSASKLQIFMAKLASRIYPSLQVGEVKDDMVTSDEVGNLRIKRFIHFY